jgi:hypothetical protein
MAYRQPTKDELAAADRIADLDDGGHEVHHTDLAARYERENHLAKVYSLSKDFADWLDGCKNDFDCADGNDVVVSTMQPFSFFLPPPLPRIW